jgi:hypothetical protein
VCPVVCEQPGGSERTLPPADAEKAVNTMAASPEERVQGVLLHLEKEGPPGCE